MRITWSEPALADLDAIHDYIARDSPHYAERFVQRLIAAADPLVDFPELGRVVPEGDGRHREIVVPPYRILYRVADDEVFIVTVIHGARDLATLWERGELG
jgi:addiction module RelE/StbE family toxin